MTLDGETLTPQDVAGVARGGLPVALSPEGRKRNEAAYRTTLRLLEDGAPVYGMNTGVGSLKAVPIPPNLLEDHQRRLLRSHAVGAGVHPDLLDALVDALNRGWRQASGSSGPPTFASLAARQTTRAVHLLASVAGAELVAGVRALRMHGAVPSPKTWTSPPASSSATSSRESAATPREAVNWDPKTRSHRPGKGGNP